MFNKLELIVYQDNSKTQIVYLETRTCKRVWAQQINSPFDRADCRGVMVEVSSDSRDSTRKYILE